jgi:hypothetical protein
MGSFLYKYQKSTCCPITDGALFGRDFRGNKGIVSPEMSASYAHRHVKKALTCRCEMVSDFSAPPERFFFNSYLRK